MMQKEEMNYLNFNAIEENDLLTFIQFISQGWKKQKIDQHILCIKRFFICIKDKKYIFLEEVYNKNNKTLNLSQINSSFDNNFKYLFKRKSLRSYKNMFLLIIKRYLTFCNYDGNLIKKEVLLNMKNCFTKQNISNLTNQEYKNMNDNTSDMYDLTSEEFAQGTKLLLNAGGNGNFTYNEKIQILSKMPEQKQKFVVHKIYEVLDILKKEWELIVNKEINSATIISDKEKKIRIKDSEIMREVLFAKAFIIFLCEINHDYKEEDHNINLIKEHLNQYVVNNIEIDIVEIVSRLKFKDNKEN